MNTIEAAERIKEHMRVHRMGKPPHILIKEALDMALEALNPMPELKEIAWLRKLKRSILDGKCAIEIKTVSGATSENLKSAAERAITDYAEFETGRYIKHLNDHIDYLREQLRGANWTPCSEGKRLPIFREDVLIQLESGNRRTAYRTGTDAKWQWMYTSGVTVGDTVLAWQPLPQPWTGDHIPDATKKVDHTVDANKMMEDQICPKCNSMAHYDPHFGRVICRQCGWTQEENT